MRQTRDAEATKAEILDAAEEEFAQHGLSGARTEAIAARTGVTKAMIYYYFSSKEELYRQVLKRPATDFMKAFPAADLETLPVEEALKIFIRKAIAHEATHPHQGKVLLHEAMQNEGKYFELTEWQTPLELGMKILDRGVREGHFRPLDPWLTMVHIMGICTFYFNARANLSKLEPDGDGMSEEAIARLTESAISFILTGVGKGSDRSCLDES